MVLRGLADVSFALATKPIDDNRWMASQLEITGRAWKQARRSRDAKKA